MNKLPSELLKMALHDLELCEQDPDFEIDMCYWVKEIDEKCRVCLAGAVIVKSFNTFSFNLDLDDPLYKIMSVIDYFRTGSFILAYQVLGRKLPKDMVSDYPICEYSFDPILFKYQLRAMIDYLESFNE